MSYGQVNKLGLTTDKIVSLSKKYTGQGLTLAETADKIGIASSALGYHLSKVSRRSKIGKGKRKYTRRPQLFNIPVDETPTVSVPATNTLAAFVGNVTTVTQAIKEMMNDNTNQNDTSLTT